MEIEISQEFFKKILLEKLKLINERLTMTNEATYSKNELDDVWHDIRESSLILEDIIDALE